MGDMSDLPVYPFERTGEGPPDEYAEFRKESPLRKVRLRNGEEAWLATRYDDVRALLADNRFSNNPAKDGYPQLSASRPVISKTQDVPPFLWMDPPRHTHFRRTVTREFTYARVQALKPLVDGVINGLIDKLIAHGPPADLVTEFALPVPTTVILHMLGVDYEEHQFFQDNANRVIATDIDPALQKHAQEAIRGRFLEIIKKKELNPAARDNIIGRLIEKQIEPGEINHAEACSILQSLVIAGHETTASMIALGMMLILRDRAKFERLRDESSPEMVGLMVEELLRYWSPVHFTGMRVATEDVEYGGVTIKAGEGVLPQVLGANYDPDIFPEPERFDIERKPEKPHLAFGFGIHQCIGQQLARLELQAVFTYLPKRLPALRLAVPAERLEIRRGSLVHGLAALPLEW